MTSRRIAICGALALVAVGTVAMAHPGGRAVVLLLPTAHYIAGAVAAIGVSALMLLAAPDRPVIRLFAWRARWRRPALGLETTASCLSFLIFLGLLVAGVSGSPDPTVNPLPLTIWTLWWVGFTLATALCGDLWRAVNPWSGPYRLLVRATGDAPQLTLPRSIGYAPAIAGLFAFAWYEIVSLAPLDPRGLAQAAGVYWSLTFLAMILFGEREWLARGECFSVFFRFVGRLAPVWTRPIAGSRSVETVIGPPGAQLLDARPPSVSGALFLLAAVATVTFDGLKETFWWLSLIGVNPLEFPGRSGVMIANTLGLTAAWIALSGAFALAVWSGARRAGTPFAPLFGRLSASLVPIALGYHLAHYLTALLIGSQYALVAASDPLGDGSDWLGLGQYFVTTSFLYDPDQVALIWNTQAGAIFGGHLLAVLLAHLMTRPPDTTRAPSLTQEVLTHGPLAALMVGYTWLGLWLLTTPTA